MGNLSFIIPTEKIEEFTIVNCLELIKKEFPYLNYDLNEEFQQIRIEDKSDELICEIWGDVCSDLENIDSDIKETEERLKNNISEHDAESLKYYKELKDANLVDKPCFNINYGWKIWNSDTRTKIVKFICKYFSAYWLDEGIHPEYMKY